jgi:hypothetical protein
MPLLRVKAGLGAIAELCAMQSYWDPSRSIHRSCLLIGTRIQDHQSITDSITPRED